MKIITLLIAAAVVTGPMVAIAQTSSFDEQEVCKAGIGTVMGREVSTMKSRKKGDEVFLSYVRADDKKKFEYKCVLPAGGDRIVWAGLIDGKWGRWRDTPADGDLTYKEVGGELIVDDTMGATNSYKKTDF